MEIDKEQIIEVLTARGEEEKAIKVDDELPDKIDPLEHQEALQELGLNTQGQLGQLGAEE